MWTTLLGANHKHLDLSCVQLDGSHTPAKNGGAAVGYQDIKAAKTSCFWQTIKALCWPALNRRRVTIIDVYELQTLFAGLLNILIQAGIPTEVMFLNADAGFDCKALRADCERRDIQANIAGNKKSEQQMNDNDTYFDEVLYKRRNVIERANAWIDSFKALLVRFETQTYTWITLHLLAFSIIFIRKIYQHK